MMINPRSVERDNQNALRKFPFSDAASCTNGSCVIVPGAIIDAQIYISGREPGSVWVSSIGTDGIVRFSDSAGEFAETVCRITENAAVPVKFTGKGGPLPGGIIVFGDAASVSALMSCGGQVFTREQTELVPAVVSYPGLTGVTGFLLDDGNTVYGNIRIIGKNGCEVSTREDEDGIGHLRFSAVGDIVGTAESRGFITKVIAESDNRSFTVSKNRSDHVIDIIADGIVMTRDDGLVADQDDICSVVRKSLGTTPSTSTTIDPECGNVCSGEIIRSHNIYFKDNDGTLVSTTPVVAYERTRLGKLDDAHMPDPEKHPGKRFVGYFDKPEGSTIMSGAVLYYRYDGAGVGYFTEKEDVTLHAHWISGESRVEVDFYKYGTLHLAAPDALAYSNPIQISGVTNPTPVIKEVSDDTLKNGGSEALADIVLHPNVPSGTVTIGIRGLRKSYES